MKANTADKILKVHCFGILPLAMMTIGITNPFGPVISFVLGTVVGIITIICLVWYTDMCINQKRRK